ncbi:MAG: hypothetical protein HY290_01900 [Planctomycetia bacterium]|nr:hypothetical protein [Planctomycetia bacterium]
MSIHSIPVIVLTIAMAAQSLAADDHAPSAPVRVADVIDGHVHPAVCVAKNGDVLAVFNKQGGGGKELLLCRSRDGGRTWSPSQPVPGIANCSIYPGSLTTLSDGRIVLHWSCYRTEGAQPWRQPQYCVSADHGQSWSNPQEVPLADFTNYSCLRHPLLELAPDRWALPFYDRTVVFDAKSHQIENFGDGRNHGMVPLVRSQRGTLISGAPVANSTQPVTIPGEIVRGLRSVDDGRTWQALHAFPTFGVAGYDLTALRNGWIILTSIVYGIGLDGEWAYQLTVSRDDGRTWETDRAVTIYNPGRRIAGRGWPRTVQLDDQTLGTLFYDLDAAQPCGPGVFFVRTPFGAFQAADADDARHARVAARRKAMAVICHRGASEFAHENTLEAYRASIELGADGNEIDIRVTRDGVLVCFHDDMLDQILDAFGDVGDYNWAELQTFAFRGPGRFGEFCRIPTLEEVFQLHRRHAALIHLDIKRPGLDGTICEMLDRMDLWDHVVAANADTAPAILKHSRFQPLRYKGSLYAEHREVDAAAIASMLAMPGDMVIVDDPRGVLTALGRQLHKPSAEPVAPIRRAAPPPARLREAGASDLLAALREDAGWDAVPQSADEKIAKSRSILRRAEAAEELRRRRIQSPEIDAALAIRVQRRSLHPEWMFHGLDGAAALRALAAAGSPRFVELARECLWRDDPATAAVLDPQFKVPRSWTDFRTKGIAFELLQQFPGAESERLCRDYLALSDEEAQRIGSSQFEAAARTLLTLRPSEGVAAELLRHRRGDVRGRAILVCLTRIDEAWAGAPHALAYRVLSE